MATMAWELGGNETTDPEKQFLGTGNNQPLVISTNGQERMRLDTDGNVGIGKTGPEARLSVVANGASEIVGTAQSPTFRTSAGSLGEAKDSELSLASIGFCSDNSTSLGIRAYRFAAGADWNTAAIGLGIDVDNTVRVNGTSLWLHPSGNVGIGTANPANILHLHGDSRDFGLVFTNNANTAGKRGYRIAFDCDRLTFQCTDDSGRFVANQVAIAQDTGNVGIGTIAPLTKLHIEGGPLVIDAALQEDGATKRYPDGWGRWMELGVPGELYGTKVSDSSDYVFLGLHRQAKDRADAVVEWGDNPDDNLIFRLQPSWGEDTKEYMRITGTGNVGIGTISPGARLHVEEGDILLSNNQAVMFKDNGGADQRILRLDQNNDVTVWNPVGGPDDDIYFGTGPIRGENIRMIVKGNGDIEVPGDIILTGADCAEEFGVAQNQAIDVGMVMVIDHDSTLKPSDQAYDKRVAGVISGAGELRPGIRLGKQHGDGRRLPLALVGKVYCKVDAQFGSIKVGDLLTTSPTPGHAMKASDPAKAFGAVIGKALGTLNAGTGMVPIIVALQ